MVVGITLAKARERGKYKRPVPGLIFASCLLIVERTHPRASAKTFNCLVNRDREGNTNSSPAGTSDWRYPTFQEESRGMPSKSTQDSFPEVRGLIYDESEMALFHAKLAYHSTIDARNASQDTNLASISEHQARILRRWEMLKQAEKELADKGKSLSAADKKQLAQYEWRYKRLEELATTKAG
ncbi:hypothetical protein ASPZODRAFT_135073 [Penicilliopsis zonata CBS 506.65]|uniref:Uncharacterized protein n=1 Tax=Penicilliopsis zonata CBS 506.65 TaxID=1073090 RepID=A0A1L9SAU9_9EURO|nr:hypothetical protein ASPZODRAFT_135073 [Penicilliopsis zonata CBS 506.65]OJJ44278.1 hypothetical protein ASPZODRAFT_135073 [Penicilliopsis zonata CBS 506.65]